MWGVCIHGGSGGGGDIDEGGGIEVELVSEHTFLYY